MLYFLDIYPENVCNTSVIIQDHLQCHHLIDCP